MKEIKVKLIGKRDECVDVKTFIFEPLDEFNYRAGQFGTFTFAGKDGKSFHMPFSFSSSPTMENIEVSMIMTGSEKKKAIDELEFGSEASIKGPLGIFTLEARKSNSLCYIVWDIGMSSVRSMLHYIADKELPLDITVIYTNKKVDTISFRKELEDMKKSIHSLKVVHVLSGLSDEEKKTWKGETGEITGAIIKKHVPDYMKTQFYIVGAPSFDIMVNDVLVNKIGISKDMIICEKYSGY